ncbi:hypothetical protein BJ875DRAFT_251676 [Amylocarpus encephaloides]|uniref:Uncharacterized protein n=1 Tax=Amylocarpus encephaloides TaxID=45428 RepID=A0A9P7YLP3_9HELO|nr:hypothetical protein BJ875DRAFT_251676 [Amylocarpus encephaloides]
MRVQILQTRVQSLFGGIRIPIAKQQCRSIHLMYAATTKSHQSNHKIKGFFPFDGYEDPEDVQLELWAYNKPLQKPAEKITLAEVMKDHLKPGHILVPVESLPGNAPKTGIEYHIHEVNTIKGPGKSKRTKSAASARHAKEIHFNSNAPISHFKHMMWKLYYMLQEGSNVEMHIHMRPELKQVERGEFTARMNDLSMLHLRHDVISMTLPECGFVEIKPWANYKTNCGWVFTSSAGGNPNCGKSDKHLVRAQKIQFQLESLGMGTLTREERLTVKQKARENGTHLTFNEKRRAAFQQVQQDHPGMTPVVQRLSKHFTTPAEILDIAKKLEDSTRIIAPLAESDPDLFRSMKRSIRPTDTAADILQRLERIRTQKGRSEMETSWRTLKLGRPSS